MNDKNPNVEQLEKRIAAAEEKARQWERRYKEATISHALKDAATAQGAFNADQVVKLLRGMTKLVETTDKKTGKPTDQFKVVVDLPETSPKTGKPVTVQKTPEEAVRRMKELPGTYGNLFVSGAPKKSTTKQQDPIDVRTLTSAQYREIRNTNPERLGLRPAYR
jgi:hypothetical protein